MKTGGRGYRDCIKRNGDKRLSCRACTIIHWVSSTIPPACSLAITSNNKPRLCHTVVAMGCCHSIHVEFNFLLIAKPLHAIIAVRDLTTLATGGFQSAPYFSGSLHGALNYVYPQDHENDF